MRQGFRWWEIDPTYYILRALAALGIVWDMKSPPEQVLRNEQRLGSRVINRAAEQLAAHFNPERIALAISQGLHGPELSAIRDLFQHARDCTAETLAGLHLPHMPDRDELLSEARLMFAKTPSLDDIVDRAHDMLLAAVGTRLATPAFD